MRHGFRVLVFSCLLVLGSAVTAESAIYKVRMENRIPGGLQTGQLLSKPVAVVHDASYSLFGPGATVTPGTCELATDGMTTNLVKEATEHAGVRAVALGDGPYADAIFFEIEGNPGDLFSVVSMLTRTNDLITGVYDVVLPANGVLEIDTYVWDAGCEDNTGLIEHIPHYGNVGVGPAKRSEVEAIDSYEVLNDPNYGPLEFHFPPAAHVRIEVLGDPVPASDTSWGAVKSLYR